MKWSKKRGDSPVPPTRLTTIPANDWWVADRRTENDFRVVSPSSTRAVMAQCYSDSCKPLQHSALSFSHDTEKEKPCGARESHATGGLLSPVGAAASSVVTEGSDCLSWQQVFLPCVNENECSRLSSSQHLKCGLMDGNSAKMSPTALNQEATCHDILSPTTMATSSSDHIRALIQVIGGLTQAVLQLTSTTQDLQLALLQGTGATHVSRQCNMSALFDISESNKGPRIKTPPQQKHKSVEEPLFSRCENSPSHCATDRSPTSAAAPLHLRSFSAELDSWIVDAVAGGLQELAAIPSFVPSRHCLKDEKTRRCHPLPDAQ